MKPLKAALSVLLIGGVLTATMQGSIKIQDKPLVPQAVPAAPQPPATPLAEAVKLYKAGLYQEAINALMQLGGKTKDMTERMKIQVYLGYTYFTINSLEEAERALTNGVRARQDADLNDKAMFPEIGSFAPEFMKFFTTVKSATVGSVYIESVPSKAAVYIDGKKVGVTPMTSDLAYQKYSIKIVKPGYSAKKLDFDFKNSDPGNIKMNLNEGRKHWKGFLQSAVLMVGLSFLIGSI